MICPKCGAEYRPGFTKCADCDVFLVSHAPAAKQRSGPWWTEQNQESALSGDSKHDWPAADDSSVYKGEPIAEPGDPNTDPFCSFWKGTDLRVCTEICTVLDEARIPHRTIRREDHLFNLNNQTPYEVGVPASLYEKAENAIRDAFGSTEDGVRLLGDGSEEAMQQIVDMPLREKLKQRRGEEVPSSLGSVFWKKNSEEKSDEASTANHEDGGEWYPEDATTLAWDGEPAEAREAIEMALKENDIGMRWEEKRGKAQLYVLPEKEERAKGIVREVVTGEPTGESEGECMGGPET